MNAPLAPALPILLTPMEVALWLSLPTGQVERMERHGDIPSIRLPNGDVVFDKAELLMWLDQLRDRPREVRRA